jgi:hypothetical protein
MSDDDRRFYGIRIAPALTDRTTCFFFSVVLALPESENADRDRMVASFSGK